MCMGNSGERGGGARSRLTVVGGVTIGSFTFHYQLTHLLIKTLSQFTFKTTHVKNVCDAYLKLIKKTQHVSVSPPTIIRGPFLYLAQLLRVSMPAG